MIFQKIRKSLLLQLSCIVLAILVVLAATLYMSYVYVQNTTRNYAYTLADSLLRQADNAMSRYEEYLKYNAEALCRFMISDELDPVYSDAVVARLSSYYSQISFKNSEIISAVIFDSKLDRIASFGKTVEFPERQVYLRTEAHMNADLYYPDDDNCYYGFYYPIYSGNGTASRLEGMCVFILEPWLIDGSLHNIMNSSMCALLLSDSNRLDLSFRTFGNIPPGLTMDDLKAGADYVYREGNWQNGIRIAVAVSVSGNTSGSGTIERIITLAAILTAGFLVIILLFSYSRMAKPIFEIDRFIDNSIEHPDRRLNLKRVDEIGTVAASLNHMLDENQRMIGELKEGKIRLYETELAQQKMEILAYRNQINPHFLYNTLSCMRDMALYHDEDNIAEMAMALSDIFRYAVKASNIVTVGDELSYIAKYARIIEYRFMGKIMVTTSVQEDVFDKPIIRFFLQPLVENAVFHGLESKLGNGSVNVHIKSREDRLEITVEDDGCGMDEEMIVKLRGLIRNPKDSNSIGLSNIVQRMKLFYGEDYTFEVESTVNVGTRMFISVPDHIRES